MTSGLESTLAGVGSSIISWIPVIFVLLIVIFGGSAFLFLYLNKMPYTCILVSKRNGGIKTFIKKGRVIAGGSKFEIDYGMFDRVKVQAPTDSQTLEGEVVVGFSPSKEEVYWCQDFEINELKLKMDPVASPAGRVLYAAGVKEIYERTQTNDKLIQWAMIGAIMVLAFSVGIGSYVGGKMVADAYGKNAEAIAASNGNIARLLENATISIMRAQPAPVTAPTGPASAPSNPGPRNPPPG